MLAKEVSEEVEQVGKTVKLSLNGRVSLPIDFRNEFGLEAGSKLKRYRTATNKIVFEVPKRAESPIENQ